jgi:alkylhydroperoxidase family enzyme
MKIIPNRSIDDYQPAALLEQIRARRGASGLLNLDRILLHSPPLAEGWNKLIGNLRRELQLQPKLRELAICTVAVLNHADYELHHHAPVWIENGATARQLAALRGLDEHQQLGDFDPAERAVIQLTIEMTRAVKVAQPTLLAARAAVGSDRELVELIAIVAAYNMVSRFLVAAAVDIEDADAAGQGRR